MLANDWACAKGVAVHEQTDRELVQQEHNLSPIISAAMLNREGHERPDKRLRVGEFIWTDSQDSQHLGQVGRKLPRNQLRGHVPQQGLADRHGD